MNIGNAELGLYLNADQVYAEIAKVETAILNSHNRIHQNLQKHYQDLSSYGIGAINGQPSVNTQPSFIETTKHKNLIQKHNDVLLEHIKAQKLATKSLSDFQSKIDKINSSLIGKPVKALQNANATIAATPIFADTKAAIKEQTLQNLIAKKEKDEKILQNLETKNAIAEQKLQNFKIDNERKKIALLRSQQIKDGSSITPLSFGGIYATMLGAYAVTTPIRQQMSFEREAAIAVKNIDYQKIQAFGGIQSAIQQIIFDAYKDPKNNVNIFGLSPEKYASNVGIMVQAGVEPTLDRKIGKDGKINVTVNKQSLKNLQEMAGLIPFVTQVLEVNEDTASEFISKAKNIFSFDYKNWKTTNPNINDSEFVKLIIAYIGDLARKNPVKAEDIFRALRGVGAGGSMAQLPLSFSTPLATMFLSQGYNPSTVGTIISKTVAGSYSHLTDPKKGIAHIADRKRMEEIYNSKEGDKKDFYGLRGDAGVLYYALSKVKEGLDNGNINKAQANKLIDYINKGRLGFQRSAATGTLWKSLDTLDKDMLIMQAQNLGLQTYGKEIPQIKKMLEQSESEKKIAAYTTGNLWERAKMVGSLSSIALGKAMAPSTNKFLDDISKFVTGYSIDNSFKKLDGKEGEEKWGGLMGALTSEAGKTLTPIIMKVVLGLVGLQVLSMVKNFAGRYPLIAKTALGRFGNIPGANKIGIGASILYDRIDPTSYYNLRKARKSGLDRDDIIMKNNKIAGGSGALLGLGLMYGNDIIANSDKFTNATKNVFGLAGSILPNEAKAGIKAMIDPTDMKNLVGFHLLTSGNKALQTAAAIHFANQYFAGSGKAKYGNDYEEPAWKVVLRAAAIGVIMSGVRNPYIFGSAVTYLGIDFGSNIVTGDIGRLPMFSDPNYYKTFDAAKNEAALEKFKKTGNTNLTPQEMKDVKLQYEKSKESDIEYQIKKYLSLIISKLINTTNVININIDKDGKATVDDEGKNNTQVKTNANQANFTPKNIFSFI